MKLSILAWLTCIAGCSGVSSAQLPVVGVTSIAAADKIPVPLTEGAVILPRPSLVLHHSVDNEAPLSAYLADSANGGTTYVSQYLASGFHYNGAIYDLLYGYASNNKFNASPSCQTWLPGNAVPGIASDSNGNLWAAEATNTASGILQEFAPNCGDPLTSIGDSSGQPVNIAFDANGAIYVEDIAGSTGLGSSPNIVVYSGAPKYAQQTVLREKAAYLGIGLAIDHNNDVFMSWVDSHDQGHVSEFRNKDSKPTTLGIRVEFIGGITFDAKQRLLVVDQTRRKMFIYGNPYDKVSAEFSLRGASVNCQFNAARTYLNCADYENGSVDVYRYDAASPGSTRLAYHYSNALGTNPNLEILGIAVTPPAKN